MKIFTAKKKLTHYLQKLEKKHLIGFVPTMGALHEGHISLIKESNKECDVTICSIFINPTQFNNSVDLANYPNSLEKDLALLKKRNCDIVYAPKVSDLYKKGEVAKNFSFGNMANLMEGIHRPGHFNGVATIIEKFFKIIKPSKAFFGEKDIQQLQIVKALAKQMKTSIEIINVPTKRDENGLAKSSRNTLLSVSDKKTASFIYSSLLYCRDNKTKGIKTLKEDIIELINSNKNIKLEYIEFVNLETMQRIEDWEEENNNAICIAAYVAGVRLIDNIIL